MVDKSKPLLYYNNRSNGYTADYSTNHAAGNTGGYKCS
jgi:hypothetical protein